MTKKLEAGVLFPEITAHSLTGETIKLTDITDNSADWKMIVVYRGKHCPLCTKYLNEVEKYKQQLLNNKIEIVAVSADTQEQLQEHKTQLNISFDICYGLTTEQMQELGIYISVPRSERETNHLFPEPAMFVVNNEGLLHVVDISNNPFVRPELQSLVSGLDWIRNPQNNYPVRGTYNY